MAAIAHVGYGYWGRNLARNFAELGALAAIVDFRMLPRLVPRRMMCARPLSRKCLPTRP